MIENEPSVNAEETTPVASPPAQVPLTSLPLGEILVIQAGLRPEHLEEALKIQAERGGRIGRLLQWTHCLHRPRSSRRARSYTRSRRRSR